MERKSNQTKNTETCTYCLCQRDIRLKKPRPILLRMIYPLFISVLYKDAPFLSFLSDWMNVLKIISVVTMQSVFIRFIFVIKSLIVKIRLMKILVSFSWKMLKTCLFYRSFLNRSSKIDSIEGHKIC